MGIEKYYGKCVVFTDSGLWVRKLRIQWQRGMLTPRPRSLGISLDGFMVLKAEL